MAEKGLRRDDTRTRQDMLPPVSLGPYHNFASTTTTTKTIASKHEKKKKKAQAQRNKRQQRQIKKKTHKKTLNRAQLKSV